MEFYCEDLRNRIVVSHGLPLGDLDLEQPVDDHLQPRIAEAGEHGRERDLRDEGKPGEPHHTSPRDQREAASGDAAPDGFLPCHRVFRLQDLPDRDQHADDGEHRRLCNRRPPFADAVRVLDRFLHLLRLQLNPLLCCVKKPPCGGRRNETN